MRPSTPVVNVIGTLTAGNAASNIAQCTSTGFRPPDVGVSWKLDGGNLEPVTNPLVSPIANNKFAVSSYYRRAVTKADNGKTLTCSVSHTSTQTILLAGNVQLSVMCKFYLHKAVLNRLVLTLFTGICVTCIVSVFSFTFECCLDRKRINRR